MEIIKKGKEPQKFLAIKGFKFAGKEILINSEISLQEPEASLLVGSKKIIPVWPQASIECIVLKTFILPGRKEKFEAKHGERVLIKADDLLPLLLDGSCIPSDDGLWRPLNRKIKTPIDKK
jgi:hypothetical protein